MEKNFSKTKGLHIVDLFFIQFVGLEKVAVDKLKIIIFSSSNMYPIFKFIKILHRHINLNY